MMDTQLSVMNKNQPSTFRLLWRPMLFLALGLHAFFLFVPLGGAQKELPQVTEQPVKYNRLPDLKPTAQKPTQKSTQKPAATASQPVQQGTIAPVPSPLTSPNLARPSSYTPPLAEPAPTERVASTDSTDDTPLARVNSTPMPGSSPPVESSLPAEPADASTAEPTIAAATQTPELDSDTQAIVERLQNLKDGRQITDNDRVEDLFTQEAVTKFFTNPEKKEGKPGLIGVEYLLPQTPAEVYEKLTMLYSDFSLKKVGEYGGGPVYEVRRDDYVRYFNLVKGKEDKSTLIVLWQDSPL